MPYDRGEATSSSIGRGICIAARKRDAGSVFLLRLSEPDDLSAVREFLRRVHVAAAVDAEGRLIASVPGAASPLHERRELMGYVATWNALNPGRLVELVEEDG
jgi:hypothetical protein